LYFIYCHTHLIRDGLDVMNAGVNSEIISCKKKEKGRVGGKEMLEYVDIGNRGDGDHMPVILGDSSGCGQEQESFLLVLISCY